MTGVIGVQLEMFMPDASVCDFHVHEVPVPLVEPGQEQEQDPNSFKFDRLSMLFTHLVPRG